MFKSFFYKLNKWQQKKVSTLIEIHVSLEPDKLHILGWAHLFFPDGLIKPPD